MPPDVNKRIRRHQRHYHECFKLFYEIQVVMNNIKDLLNEKMKELNDENIDVSLIIPHADKLNTIE